MRDLFGTVCLAGAIQSLLLCFVLLARKSNRTANRFLAVFLFFLALDALELFLASRGHVLSSLPNQLSVIPYSFVFGPSVFIYAALLTGRIRSFSGKYLLLYAPFAVLLAANVALLLVLDPSRPPRAAAAANMVTNGGGLLLEASLYAASLFMIRKFTAGLKEYFSALDAKKLFLLQAGLAVLILIVLVFFASLAGQGHVRREYKLPDVIAVLVSLALGFGIAFLAMLQPGIFGRVRLAGNAPPGDAPSPRYEKFRFSEAEEERCAERLREYMERERPYLQEDLTLQDLADGLSLSPHRLSMILNIRFGQNFYNFINSYRVEEVKRRLDHPGYRDQNILTIAFGAGFNSKTAFNAMFKKFTGKTPRQYRAPSA